MKKEFAFFEYNLYYPVMNLKPEVQKKKKCIPTPLTKYFMQNY